MASIKMQGFLEKFAEVSARVGNGVHLRSLRDAFTTVMPLYILAGIAVLINNVVFPLIFKDAAALAAVQTWGKQLTLGTLSFSGIILAGVIGFCHARNKFFEDQIACVILSISAFVIMMPQTITATLASDAMQKVVVAGAYASANTGTNGLFGAILIGLLATSLFIKFSEVKQLRINLGEGVPPAVADSFNVMLPMLLTLACFGVVSAILAAGFNTNLVDLIKVWIQAPLAAVNTSVWDVILIYFVANLLFCVGIHQSTISGVLVEPLLTIAITDNIAAFAAGGFAAIQPDHYMNMQIINTFALIGGSGCTLCLLIATFLFSKSKSSRSVAKLAILPGIFNINEPVIYGYPIVFNLPLMLGFVLVPTLFIAASYYATVLGLINPAVVMVPWTTPVFLSGFLATAGDWRAVVFQVVEVAVGVLIYLPLMRASERAQALQAQAEAATEAEA